MFKKLRALLTIPTNTITETSELIHATTKVILEMLGYEIKNRTCRECPPLEKEAASQDQGCQETY